MKLELKPHQQEAFEFSKDRIYFANFDDMGLGKTLTELARIHHLWKLGKITAVVWITPKSITHDVAEHVEAGWPDEDPPPELLVWKRTDSITYAKKYQRLLEVGGPLKLFVINVEAFSSASIEPWVLKFSRAHHLKNFVVVDEASRIKERSAIRTKRILKLFSGHAYRDIMTGSPVLNTPTDLWAPCKLLSPAALGLSVGANFYAFRARYSEIRTDLIWVKTAYGPKQRAIPTLVGYRNLPDLADRLKRFSVRRTAEEVLDLPPRRYIVRHVELTQDQIRLVDRLKRELRVLINDAKVQVTNVLSLMAKLHQVLLGFLIDEDGSMHTVRSHRLTELDNVLEEVQGKVIIWATHHASIDLLMRHLRATHGEESVVDYYGETSDTDRPANLDKFRNRTVCRFLVANPTVGGIGLTLTAACTCVYWNNTFRLEDRLQSERRVWRISQERPVLYIDLICPKTLDETILKALQDKVDVSQLTLGDRERIRRLFEGE